MNSVRGRRRKNGFSAGQMNRNIGVGIEYGLHNEYPVISVFGGGVHSESAVRWLKQYPEQVQGILDHPRQRRLVEVDAGYDFSQKESNEHIMNELLKSTSPTH